MRLPSGRWRGVILVAVAAAVVTGWVWAYRPWEAHYRWRPANRWAELLAARPLVDLPPPQPTAISSTIERGLAILGIQWDPNAKVEFDLGEDRKAIPVLIELLKNPNPHVRWWAAILLRDFDPPAKEAVPVLRAVWRRYKGDASNRLSLEGGLYATAGDAADMIEVALFDIDRDAAKEEGIGNEPSPLE